MNDNTGSITAPFPVGLFIVISGRPGTPQILSATSIEN